MRVKRDTSLSVLMSRIAQGEKTALNDLFEQCSQSVYRYAFVLLKDTSLAQDVTQEVFLKVHLKADSYKQENSDVMGWLLTVARNAAISELRKHGRCSSIGDEITEFPSSSDCFADLRYGEIISGLPPVEQEIITLHLVYGLKHKEIAQILSMSAEVIRQRYTRALKKLEQTMKSEGGRK